MSTEQPDATGGSETLFAVDKVDLVALVDGIVELHIVVDITWTGSDDQLMSLQHKVNTYVAYVLDGQLSAQYPQVAGRPWRIVVACRTGRPDPRSAEMLRSLADPLDRYGGELEVRGRS